MVGVMQALPADASIHLTDPSLGHGGHEVFARQIDAYARGKRALRVLSACFHTPSDPGCRTYVALARVGKLPWRLDPHFGDHLAVAAHSPYLVAIRRA